MKEIPGNCLQAAPVSLSLSLRPLLLRHPKIGRTDSQARFALGSVLHTVQKG